MSRLIDADELLKGRDDHEMISTHLIWNAPTIEPTVDKDYLIKLIQEAVYDGEACKRLLDLVDRPQGVWKVKSFHEFICDNCGFSFDMMKCYFLENMKHCPECGVRKGVDDEHDK